MNGLKSFHPMDLARYEGDMVCHRFSHRIGWLRHCQPTIVMLHKDVTIKNLNSFTGSMICLSSLDNAVRSAIAHCDTFKIDEFSTLHIDVIMEVIDVPVIEVSGGTGPIPDGWLIYDEAKRQEMDAYNAAIDSGEAEMPEFPTGMDELLPKAVHTQLVWSSKLVTGLNALIVYKFKETWVPQDVLADA